MAVWWVPLVVKGFIGAIKRRRERRRIRKELARIRKEDGMDVAKVLGWLVNLKLVPAGWLTKGTGWVALLIALACFLGYQPSWLACPVDAGQALLTGLIGIGLGRRGTS